MSRIESLLAATEFVAPTGKVITKIIVDGLVGSYAAKSLVNGEANIAVLNTYTAADVSAVASLNVFAEGRFSNVYNATGSANLRLVVEDS